MENFSREIFEYIFLIKLFCGPKKGHLLFGSTGVLLLVE